MKSVSPLLSLLLSIMFALSMGFFVLRIWSDGQPENFSDLYAPWWAAHELLLHGRNPYSQQIAHEIQVVIYGDVSAISPEDPSGIAGGFAYPPVAALLLAPFVATSFNAAKIIFLVVAVLLTLFSVEIWLRVLHYKLAPLFRISVFFFVAGSFPALQGLKLENLSVIAAAFLAITVFLLRSGRLASAGIFLALSTFKPQLAFALVVWTLLWTAAEWRNRKSLLASFALTTTVFALVSEWLVPGWFGDFVHVVRLYRHYTYGHSLLDVWFTPAVGPLIAAAALVASLALCWPFRREPAHSTQFVLVVAFILAVSLLVIPTLAPHAQLLLVPGVLYLVKEWKHFLNGKSVIRQLWLGTALLVAWPWLATVALLGAAFVLPRARLFPFWQVPLYSSPILPFAVAVVLAVSLSRAPRNPSVHVET